MNKDDRRDEIEESLEYVKGTMAYEDMDLNEKEIELFRKILEGKCNSEEVRRKLIERYSNPPDGGNQ